MTVFERFLRQVHIDPDGCWLWQSFLDADGYGRFAIGDRRHRAHRLAHLWWVAPIGDGHDVDHICFQRSCVRPSHLQSLPLRVNRSRQRSALKTRCVHDHDLSDAYIRPNGRRDCKVCIRERARSYRARKAA